MDDSIQSDRRKFLKSSGVAAAAASLPVASYAQVEGKSEIKVALVGCGGRGTGAVSQTLSVEGSKLVAVADAFPDKTQGVINNIKGRFKEKVDVPEARMFHGFDAYKKAIAFADMVILTTPPGFRPEMFEYAVSQGKHVFMEKPIATDAAGIRRVIAAAKEADAKKLKVVCGLQRRYQKSYTATHQEVMEGRIGKVLGSQVYWNGGGVWVRPRQEKQTEMEYQMRNWYYFVWICGDHITEQHIHNLDVINWLKNDFPVRANGMGGAEVRVGIDYGEIFDHHTVEFEYADGSRMYSQCRHQVGCWNSVSEHAHGSKGSAEINRYIIRGENSWRFGGKGKNPYQQEHDDLFHAIRNNVAYNEAEYGAKSSMTSILGRMATYSGKVVEWKDAINSQISTLPEAFAWDAMPKSLPGPDGMYATAVPGKTVVV